MSCRSTDIKGVVVTIEGKNKLSMISRGCKRCELTYNPLSDVVDMWS
jgi:hypothetical protein